MLSLQHFPGAVRAHPEPDSLLVFTTAKKAAEVIYQKTGKAQHYSPMILGLFVPTTLRTNATR